MDRGCGWNPQERPSSPIRALGVLTKALSQSSEPKLYVSEWASLIKVCCRRQKVYILQCPKLLREMISTNISNSCVQHSSKNLPKLNKLLNLHRKMFFTHSGFEKPLLSWGTKVFALHHSDFGGVKCQGLSHNSFLPSLVQWTHKQEQLQALHLSVLLSSAHANIIQASWAHSLWLQKYLFIAKNSSLCVLQPFVF